MSVLYLRFGHNCFLPHPSQCTFTNHLTFSALCSELLYVFLNKQKVNKLPPKFCPVLWRAVFQRHAEKMFNRRLHYFALSGIFYACPIASVIKVMYVYRFVCLQDTDGVLILRTSECDPATAVGRTGCLSCQEIYFVFSTEETASAVT
jgi:hypothetical protein